MSENKLFDGLTKAFTSANVREHGISGENLEFIRGLLTLNNHEDFLSLVDRFEFDEAALDKVKADIKKLEAPALKASVWVEKLQTLLPVYDTGDDFV